MLCGQCVFAPYVDWLLVGGVPVFVNQCWQWTFGLIKVSTSFDMASAEAARASLPAETAATWAHMQATL
jgi:hypothetical protein